MTFKQASNDHGCGGWQGGRLGRPRQWPPSAADRGRATPPSEGRQPGRAPWQWQARRTAPKQPGAARKAAHPEAPPAIGGGGHGTEREIEVFLNGVARCPKTVTPFGASSVSHQQGG